MEKMLVAEALDERDLLTKKIKTAITNSKYSSVRREKDPKLANGQTDDEFAADAKATFQSIVDMIDRLNRINAAIVLSNANTIIKLRSGIEMTVAAAITKRKQMTIKDDIEDLFIRDLAGQAKGMLELYDSYKKEKEKRETAYKTNFSNRDKLSKEDAEAIESLLKGDEPVMVDPIGIVKLSQEKQEAYAQLAKEIDTAIKVSNATTVIEF